MQLMCKYEHVKYNLHESRHNTSWEKHAISVEI